MPHEHDYCRECEVTDVTLTDTVRALQQTEIARADAEKRAAKLAAFVKGFADQPCDYVAAWECDKHPEYDAERVCEKCEARRLLSPQA